MPAYQRITPPAVEPVLLRDAKAWLRLDPTDTTEDALVTALIVSARELCETYTSSKFVKQTWRMYLDAFPGYLDPRSPSVQSLRSSSTGAWFWMGTMWGIGLPFGPVQSVSAVAYNDANGNLVTLNAGTDYNVDVYSTPARVMPIWSQFWPMTQYAPNAVHIDFIAGYGGAGQAALPQSISTAIMMLVSSWYRNRETYTVGTGPANELPNSVKSLLGQFRDVRF